MTVHTSEPLVGSRLLEKIVDLFDIPKSLYDRAVQRHKSFGEWLCRPESTLAAFQPHVSSQGSFRYGTVNRPLNSGEEYDLDNVTTLALMKALLSQRQLKTRFGEEVKSYARAHGMHKPVEEKNRCWRLVYSDEVSFHLDTVPSIPEEIQIYEAIRQLGVDDALARRAVAITDRRHPLYDQITPSWPSSNPRGFARWFEWRARPAAATRMRQLVSNRMYATVDDVPPYEWKTPLQQSIQIMKRHRDVMFRENADIAPISMIITNLAAHSYEGELDLGTALTNIIARMPRYVRPTHPRIPNPTDPREDYADKWSANPDLEKNFWVWHAQLTSDIQRLGSMPESDRLVNDIRRIFAVDLSDDDLVQIGVARRSTIVVASAPRVQISSPPRPWRR